MVGIKSDSAVRIDPKAIGPLLAVGSPLELYDLCVGAVSSGYSNPPTGYRLPIDAHLIHVTTRSGKEMREQVISTMGGYRSHYLPLHR